MSNPVSSGGPVGTPIELRVDAVAQLFDTLDPFPFRERDLDKDAEEYIVSWARELPREQPIRIVVYLPQAKLSTGDANDLQQALRRYFDYRASGIRRELHELFRIGWRSLIIGLTALTVIVLAGEALVGLSLPDPIGRIAEESALILGWVANWRPLEIFLYDWWPLVRRRRLYRRLAQSVVELRYVA
jgi:hypothetical protein